MCLAHTAQCMTKPHSTRLPFLAPWWRSSLCVGHDVCSLSQSLACQSVMAVECAWLWGLVGPLYASSAG